MENYFISPLALIPLIPLIVEWLKINLKLKDQVLFAIFKRKIYFAQVITVGISIVLCFVGMYFGLGFLAGASVLVTIIWGVVIGLASAGTFHYGYIDTIQATINYIINQLKRKKHGNNSSMAGQTP